MFAPLEETCWSLFNHKTVHTDAAIFFDQNNQFLSKVVSKWSPCLIFLYHLRRERERELFFLPKWKLTVLAYLMQQNKIIGFPICDDICISGSLMYFLCEPAAGVVVNSWLGIIKNTKAGNNSKKIPSFIPVQPNQKAKYCFS